MSIMDFFSSKAPEQQAPAQQPMQSSAPATPPSTNGSTAQGTNEPSNPLDVYAKMFEKVAQPDVAPSLNLDPEVLSKVSSGMDFTHGVSQELMQKATSGDASALIEMMQMVGRNSYKAALSHQSALTDKFVGARTEHAMKGIGSHVKSEMTTNALAATPNYQHPVVKEQLNQLARQFSAQQPDATPDQVAGMAVKYMQDLAAAISPQQATPQQQAAKSEVDWDKYFGA